jgi:hypothetical protein
VTQFVEGRFPMIQPKSTGIHEVLRDVIAQNLERSFYPGARRYGSLCAATKVGVIKIYEAVGCCAHLTPRAQLLPQFNASGGAHEREERRNGLVFSNHDSVNTAHLTSFCGDAEAVSGANECHGCLVSGCYDIYGRLATRIGKRAGSKKSSAPDRRQFV